KRLLVCEAGRRRRAPSQHHGRQRHHDERRASHASGTEANRSSPSCCERNRVANAPLTLLPASSSSGLNVPSPPLPGETVTTPPPIPLLPGRPTSYSQSPEVSYRPAVAITASA